MPNETKARILTAALDLFSENGYDGTNMQGIADSVGIVKSALYRHYKSKGEIFDAMLDYLTAYYDEHFVSADGLPTIPKNGTELSALAMRMLDFTVNDATIVKVRKILTVEQFRFEKANILATKYFYVNTESFFVRIFDGMMKNGVMKRGDAALLAFEFSSPITVLIHDCDRDPKRKNDNMEKAKKHVDRFCTENVGNGDKE